MSYSKQAMFDEIEAEEEAHYQAVSRAQDRQVGGDHYKRLGVEPWTVIADWPLDQQIGFFRGNALKYLMRAGSKGSWLEDIKKAHHYLDRLIEVAEAGALDTSSEGLHVYG